MRKTLTASLLALCLLAGCAFSNSAGQTAQPASAIPLVSPSPEASAAAALQPVSEGVSPQPLPSSSAPVTAPPESANSPDAPSPSVSSAHPSTSPSPEAPLPDKELSEQLDALFAGWPEFYGSVLIARGDQILLYKGYGLSDAEMGSKNSPDSKFLVGSVTKQFTAMAIMQLYEKGLLDIHDKLSKYIPDFNRGGDIVLTQLLTQNSGITDYLNDKPTVISQIPCGEISVETLLDRIKTMPLKFEPGSKYTYSNSNYLILGRIVEEVSGLKYGDYLQRYILEPLGMENTGVFDIGSPPDGMTTGHTSFDAPVRFFEPGGDIIPEKAGATAGSFGAGCLYSTVGDLYTWDRALATEKLLSKKYMDMIFTFTVPVPGALITSDYGFGWVIQTDPDCGTIFVHTGVLGGFRAYNGRYIDKGMTVIVLMNTMSFPDRDKLIPAVKQVLNGDKLEDRN